MQVEDAQRQIRLAFVGGGPGVIVSSLIWFVAAWFMHTRGLRDAFVALFLGGMLIFPTGSLACKVLFGRSASVRGNPLGLLPLESTIAMIGCLLAAWLMLAARPEAMFPVAAIAVGTHYLAFRTAYGDRTYWVFGGIVSAIGLAGIFWFPDASLAIVLAVAVIEFVFGLFLTRQGMASAR